MATRSVTRTIRIDEEADKFLQGFAQEEGVSVNFLINRALRKYVQWDTYADKFGMVSLPGSLVAKIMDLLTEEEARELGRWVGQNLVKEFITFWFKEVSLRVLVKGYPQLTAQYGGAFEYEEHSEGGRWVLILKHGMGTKWSAYYEELFRAVFRDVFESDVKVETMENQVVVRFSLA